MRQVSHSIGFFALTVMLLSANPASADLFNHVGGGSRTHATTVSADQQKRKEAFQNLDFAKANEAGKAATEANIKSNVATRQAQTAKTISALNAANQKASAAQASKNADALKRAQADRVAALQSAHSSAPLSAATKSASPTAVTAPDTSAPDLFNAPSGSVGTTPHPIFGVQ